MMIATPYGDSRNALRYAVDQRLREADLESVRDVAFMDLKEIRNRLGADRAAAAMVRRMCRDWIIDQWAFEDAAWERGGRDEGG